MHGSEIRRRFLQFFQERDHLLLESAPLLPEDDPTTLFISAGMQPLQPYYQGLRQPPAPRLVSCQRVVRTWDLDEVGKTDRHATFFEMLGNFAPTGAYFKETAIPLAWEFCIDREHGLGMDPERLWVTTHPSDEEARRLWREQGVPESRVLEADENWWGLGVGPAGPDSELWYDRGPAYACGDPVCYPDHKEGCIRHLEFWNLVFPSFDEQPDGTRRPLPNPGIDTGMGLERVTSLVQEVPSIFDTDLMRPLTAWARDHADRPGVVTERVLADHLRSMTFVIADGVLPANEGRGYVLRRLIRHAALEARRAGLRVPLADGVRLVVEQMRDQYPFLVEREAEVHGAVAAESEQFARTLDRGLELFDRIAAGAHDGLLAGDQVFRLHDTEGFPVELTRELAAERDLRIDEDGFERAMADQRERSRRTVVHSWADLRSLPPSEFIGYDELEASAEVVLLRSDGHDVEEAGEGQEVEVYLDRTPFYGEAGGQIGDTGDLRGPDGAVRVEDTKHPLQGVTAHLGRVTVGRLRRRDRIDARVDRERRHQIMRHHSATHLLNRALEEVLGRRNLQRGSWVGPDHTTFDFPLERALTDEEQDQVLRRIDQQIRAALPRGVRLLPREEAEATGATHLFDEKYGDQVRVVSFGDWSSEFCGGTHVATSADCGPVAILAESSVGQGLRRIDLAAGTAAEDAIARRWHASTDLARTLGTAPERVPEQVEALRREVREARRESERLRDELRTQTVRQNAGGGAAPRQRNTRVPVILEEVPAGSMDDLRGWADRYLEVLGGSGVVGVANDSSFVLKVSRNLTADVQANRLAPLMGRGGGRPEMAQGRLDHPAQEAFQALEEALA